MTSLNPQERALLQEFLQRLPAKLIKERLARCSVFRVN